MKKLAVNLMLKRFLIVWIPTLFLLGRCTTPSKQDIMSLQGSAYAVTPSEQAYFASDRSRVRIFAHLDAADAAQKASQLKESYAEYFLPKIEPYSGKSTLPEWCSLKNLPAPMSITSAEGFFTQQYFYSSDNFQVGCIASHPLRAQSLLLYCQKERTLLNALILLKPDSQWVEKQMIHCLKTK